MNRVAVIQVSPSIMSRLRCPFAGVFTLGALLSITASTFAQEMKPATEQSVKKAAVLVFTARSEREKGDTPIGSGSGFFINSTGLVVTNNHVVDPTHAKSDTEKQEFHYKGGKLTWSVVINSGTTDESKQDCIVIYQNEMADQALCQVYDSAGKKLRSPGFLRLIPDSRLEPRMKVYALGFPGGDAQRSSNEKHPEVTITAGNVLELSHTTGGRLIMIYTDVIARPGNSGGPMVDVDGFVLGAVTLMTKPEGRVDAGGANYSALSPAKLTREMLRSAFKLSKIPEGVDYLPFIEVLRDGAGRIEIPEYRRQKEKDVLFFPNGDRIYGTLATDKIQWESGIGTLEIPALAVAYAIRSDDGASIFLEGGNRIAATSTTQKFQFKPDGGQASEFEFDKLTAVGFRSSRGKPQAAVGRLIVLDSDLSHLVLSEVGGTAQFKHSAGTIDVNFEDIDRIDKAVDGDDQVLIFADGRRLTGRFSDAMFSAKVAGIDCPMKFNLSKVTHASVDVVYVSPDGERGINLIAALAKADRPIRRIADKLEAGDVKGARSRLAELMVPEEYKSLPDVTKEQITLLDGVTLLREGQWEGANKALRKASKSSDKNIVAYAEAHVSVLKRYESKFDGKPLSDPAVFAAAGRAWSKESLNKVRDVLKDSKSLTGKKGEFATTVASVKKYEDIMPVTAIFAGVAADNSMLRLWRLATQVAKREVERIDKEIADKQPNPQAAPSGRGQNQVRLQREVGDLQMQREKAIEVYRHYMAEKIWDYGFRIEDPDLDLMEEKSGDNDD